MFASDHVFTATQWWCRENAVDPMARRLLPFFFETLDALYATVLRFPVAWASDAQMPIKSASARPTYAELANHSAYRQSCNYPASELIYAA
jgi:hypothetical protein